jgi:hypothetical protein
VIESKAQSEIVMFVPHLEIGRETDGGPQGTIRLLCDHRTPILGMYKQELQGWRSARIVSMSRDEITFLLDETQPPSGPIRIVVAGETGIFPFRAVCSAKVVRVVQNPSLGDAVQVSAHIHRWEFIKPKSRRKPIPIR